MTKIGDRDVERSPAEMYGQCSDFIYINRIFVCEQMVKSATIARRCGARGERYRKREGEQERSFLHAASAFLSN